MRDKVVESFAVFVCLVIHRIGNKGTQVRRRRRYDPTTITQNGKIGDKIQDISFIRKVIFSSIITLL